MEENQPLEVIDQQFMFEMAVVSSGDIFECRVFSAILPDGTRFTRVLYGEADDERTIDVDFWEGVGWIDMWYGEPSPWSALVGPSLDFYIAQNKKQ